VQIIFVF